MDPKLREALLNAKTFSEYSDVFVEFGLKDHSTVDVKQDSELREHINALLLAYAEEQGDELDMSKHKDPPDRHLYK